MVSSSMSSILRRPEKSLYQVVTFITNRFNVWSANSVVADSGGIGKDEDRNNGRIDGDDSADAGDKSEADESVNV